MQCNQARLMGRRAQASGLSAQNKQFDGFCNCVPARHDLFTRG